MSRPNFGVTRTKFRTDPVNDLPSGTVQDIREVQGQRSSHFSRLTVIVFHRNTSNCCMNTLCDSVAGLFSVVYDEGKEEIYVSFHQSGLVTVDYFSFTRSSRYDLLLVSLQYHPFTLL